MKQNNSVTAKTGLVRMFAAMLCAIMLISFTPIAGHAAEASTTPAKLPAYSVTLIGDSVSLGAELFGNFKNRVAKMSGVSWCRVDNKGSRQLAAGISTAKKLKKQGKLGDIVVFALTTNGSFSYDSAKKAMTAVGKTRTVIFVTGYNHGYTYFNRSNTSIRKLAKKYPSRVYVADWNKFIKAKKSKKFSDGKCHLTRTSAKWYTDLVMSTIKKVRADKKAALKKAQEKAAKKAAEKAAASS